MSYLDLLIDVSNGNLVCSMFSHRDAFDFHVVNFSDLFGNIPIAKAYRTYILKLIRYTHAGHN